MGNFLMGIAKTISYIVTILTIIGVIYFYNTFIHKDYENVNIPEKDEMQYLRCEFPKSINTPNGNKDWKDSKNIKYSLFSIDIKKDVLKDDSVEGYYLNFTNGEIRRTTMQVTPTQICFWGRDDDDRNNFCASRKDLSIYGSKYGRGAKNGILLTENNPYYPYLNKDGSWGVESFLEGAEGQCSFIDKDNFEAKAEEYKSKYDKKIEDQNRAKEEELKAKTKDNII